MSAFGLSLNTMSAGKSNLSCRYTTMSFLQKIRRNSYLKKRAQAAERFLKRQITHLLGFLIGTPNEVSTDSLNDIKRILLIRPNYRIGNALISTRAIQVFQQRFPNASIDFLATENTFPIFENLPLRKIHGMTRKAITQPWLLITLIRNLRKEKYDLVVQMTSGSVTGIILTRLIKASYTMGTSKKDHSWYDYEIDQDKPDAHAYDMGKPFAAYFQQDYISKPWLVMSQNEKEDGLNLRRRIIDHEQFIGIFVGGHLDKRSPINFWLEVSQLLSDDKIAHIIFIGPEEMDHAETIEQALKSNHYGALCRPKPLREFASLLQQADLLVTPDSGPMHMAAAVDTHVLAILRSKVSTKFIPPAPYGEYLWQPSAQETFEAIKLAR